MKRSLGTFALILLLLLTTHTRGASAQCCGDCNADGEVTVDELVSGVDRALTRCQDDGICSMASCPAQLTQCQTDLADCRAQPGGQRFPASGQTTSYGPGSDGDLQAGAALAYTDNGDGTITDNNTGLMWEKKDASGGIHDQDKEYTWGDESSSYPFPMNGTMVTLFLATLNQQPCFAGHCDWRIPNVKELHSIVNYGDVDPAVSSVFNTGCSPGCTVTTCSCTRSFPYWSATTADADAPLVAFFVNFYEGGVSGNIKPSRFFVRAVRGGL